MRERVDADVIVVGAGPAGSSAAYHLARLGRRVLLLDRARFPRDKSCGDGLTRSTVRTLAGMGVLPRLEGALRTRGVRIQMRGQGSRTFDYPEDLIEPGYGLVVPRMVLDEVLCRHAAEAGAELYQETLAERLVFGPAGEVAGVEVSRGGERRTLRAPVVVAADGASSRLAHQAGLVGSAAPETGVAIRGYYEGIEGLTDALEIFTPLLDPTDRYLLPSYGWIFPTGPGCANVGVGLFQRERGANVRDLMERFMASLRAEDPRFRGASLRGAWRGAPLRFDFAPERCAAPGLLLAGDAAGMISPFTGEGIGFALESGGWAAETVHRALDAAGTHPPDLSDYPARLARGYSGYFEAGRHSARRYLLVWHVLESTFQNDRPLFTLCRQAALFPEGIGDSFAGTVLDNVAGVAEWREMPVRADLVVVGEMLVETARRDWPFLANLLAADQSAPGVPLRPALFLLLAAYATGGVAGPGATAAAAAVELGFLASLAHLSVGEEPAGAGAGARPANWGNMFALMVGDFLMSRAYELSARVAAGASGEIAEALGTACEGRVRELRTSFDLRLGDADALGVVERKTGILFELPCRLGARLSAAPQAQVDALSTFGRHTGIAFQLADDVLALTGRASQLGKVAGADPENGVYGLPVLRAARNGAGPELRRLLGGRPGKAAVDEALRLVAAGSAPAGVLALAEEHVRRARAALSPLPDGPARRALDALAVYAVARVHTGPEPRTIPSSAREAP